MIHRELLPVLEERGASMPLVADIGILLDIDVFCAWLAATVGSDRSIGPHDPPSCLRSDLGRFRALVALERLVGEGFPDELVESIESIAELYEWTLIKMERASTDAIGNGPIAKALQ